MTTEKTIGTIQATINVTDEHIDCILSGAFEGGSNDWINRVWVLDIDYKGTDWASEVVSKGGSLWISEGSNKHLLTLEKMIRGCQLYVRGYKNTKGREFDIDAWDVIDHDMSLQYAIFGAGFYG